MIKLFAISTFTVTYFVIYFIFNEILPVPKKRTDNGLSKLNENDRKLFILNMVQ